MDQVLELSEVAEEQQVIELPTDLLGQVGGGAGGTNLN
jgi:hypothetical protein